MVTAVRIVMLGTAALALGGCAAWQSEREAAHRSASERAAIFAGAATSLAGGTTATTTTTQMGPDGQPIVTEETTTEPGDRQLVDFSVELQPGAQLAITNSGSAPAILQVGVAEPAASLVNSLAALMDQAGVSRDALMADAFPAAVGAAESLTLGGLGIWGAAEMSRNNQPTIVNQPAPLVVDQPEPLVVDQPAPLVVEEPVPIE